MDSKFNTTPSLGAASPSPNQSLLFINPCAPTNPSWVYNLRANPDVEIRDATEVFKMMAREVHDEDERRQLWAASAEAFPPYNEYQSKTTRRIPVFLAEPV